MFALPPLPADVPSLLIGFSGGLDSTVLLHRLRHDPAFNRADLRAVHVHHGLQAAADDWAGHCRQVCDAWEIPLEVARVKVSPPRGQGLEAAARHARYAAFAGIIRPGEVLVTAHHLQDQAETFLLRALRASGVDGLAAMRDWRAFAEGWHWRPLLDIPRATLEAHARHHGLDWIEDPSNLHTAHSRNFLRLHVMPLLEQHWPHASAALARSAALAGESASLLEQEDADALAMTRTLDPAALSATALLALPPARRARVLRRWLEECGLPPLPAEGVRRIGQDLLAAAADGEAEFAWQGAVVRRWRDLLHAERARAPLSADWETEWDTRSPLRLPTGDTLILEGAVWPTPLRVGARHGGERLRLPGRAHTHVLKKLLQSEGIPPWERRLLPLLWDAGGELLAAGDLLPGARLDEWLRRHGATLRWERTGA